MCHPESYLASSRTGFSLSAFPSPAKIKTRQAEARPTRIARFSLREFTIDQPIRRFASEASEGLLDGPELKRRAGLARLSQAVCAVTIIFGWRTRAARTGVTAVSDSNTSRPAPEICSASSAAKSAASSIKPPRAVLIIAAVFFIFAKAAAPNRCCVSPVSGACSEMKSARASNASNGTSSALDFAARVSFSRDRE